MSDSNSSKRDKFVSLAEKRVSKALKDIELVGNLSNRMSYDYSDKDVKQIFRALNAAVADAKAKFSPSSEKARSGFSLK